MTFQALAQQTVSGISGGMILFLIAAGLSIIFGTLKILNLAHGSFYMVSGFLCYSLTSKLAHFSGAFWWTLLVAPILVAVLCGLIEKFLLRRIYSHDHYYQFIFTLGMLLAFGDICKFFFGVTYKAVAVPWPFNEKFSLLGIYFPAYNLFLLFCGVVVFIGISALMRYSGLGRIVRAVTYNREMANALGINVPMVYTGVFMLGGYLAGLAGTLMPPLSLVSLGSDVEVLLESFIIVVIGGLGNFTGAFIGAVMLGLLKAFGIYVMPKLAIAFPFMLMIFILLFRPWGLLGKPE